MIKEVSSLHSQLKKRRSKYIEYLWNKSSLNFDFQLKLSGDVFSYTEVLTSVGWYGGHICHVMAMNNECINLVHGMVHQPTSSRS